MMLSNCHNYQHFYTTLKALFQEHPVIVVTGFDVNENEYPMQVVSYNTWQLEIDGVKHTGPATNIREMLEHALRLAPAKIVALEFSVTGGGNTYKMRKEMGLSSPEAVTSTFAELFRRIINERNRQS